MMPHSLFEDRLDVLEPQGTLDAADECLPLGLRVLVVDADGDVMLIAVLTSTQSLLVMACLQGVALSGRRMPLWRSITYGHV